MAKFIILYSNMPLFLRGHRLGGGWEIVVFAEGRKELDPVLDPSGVSARMYKCQAHTRTGRRETRRAEGRNVSESSAENKHLYSRPRTEMGRGNRTTALPQSPVPLLLALHPPPGPANPSGLLVWPRKVTHRRVLRDSFQLADNVRVTAPLSVL